MIIDYYPDDAQEDAQIEATRKMSEKIGSSTKRAVLGRLYWAAEKAKSFLGKM
jgi:hypothetical protein